MKTTRFLSVALFALVVLLAPRMACAQLTDFYSSPGYSSMINTMINNKIWEAAMERYTKDYKGTPGAAGTRPSAKASTYEVPAYRIYPAVRFKPTGTRITLQPYLDIVEATPQDKAELKELVLDIFKKYEAESAAREYPNDWALAYVSFVGLNSHVYNGRTEKPLLPFEQNIGMRDFVAENATNNGIFDGVSDRRKQELYEFLVMFGGLTYHLYEKAVREKNDAEIKNAKLAAAQNLRLLGVMP